MNALLKAQQKAEKWARRAEGEFLFEGHALQGMTPIMVVGRGEADLGNFASRLAADFNCTVLAEMGFGREFSGKRGIVGRVWVPRKYAEAIKALYREETTP